MTNAFIWILDFSEDQNIEQTWTQMARERSRSEPHSYANESVYQTIIKPAILPEDPGKQKELHGAHFNYRQVIGEAMYAIVAC